MSKARGASAARSARRGANMYKVRPSNVGPGKRFARIQHVFKYTSKDKLKKRSLVLDKWGNPIILKTIIHFNDQHY